jgi:iron complex transport system substrate-binding protein
MLTTPNTMFTKLTMTTKRFSPGRMLFVSIVCFVAFVTGASVRTGAAVEAVSQPARIISLIPAVTEMLFAIGAGPKVVGVSSFDEYPPEATKLPRVGALIDPDLERILSLRPDLVIVYGSQTDLLKQLERAQIPAFVYRHGALSDITVTIGQLGARTGHEAEATTVIKQIDDRLADIRRRVSGRPKPKTMLVFGRDALALRGIYASGGIGFLHDMLEAAGGENVFADVKQQAVQATSELVLARAPEFILELRSGDITPELRQKEIAVWQALPAVPAVRTGRIAIINDPRTMIPGPRVADATELIARALHPEAF